MSPALGKKFLADTREHSGMLGEGLDTLLAISNRLSHDSRGRDEAKRLLSAASSSLLPDALITNVGNTGDLLAWHGWCEVPCQAYDGARERIWERVVRLDFEVDELRRFTEGLWLYDGDDYYRRINAKLHELDGYLRWQLDLLRLYRDEENRGEKGEAKQDTDNSGALSIEFFVTDYEKAGKETVQRLEALQAVFPFYAGYNSQGIWPLPLSAILWHDPTIKRWRREPNEPELLQFHKTRNTTWSHVVESKYALDNYYTYQRDWYELRLSCLEFVNHLSRRLRAVVTGQVTNFNGAFPGNILERTERSLTTTPHPPGQTPEEMKDSLKPADE